MTDRIALIGMPGSGKTSLGQRLSGSLGLPFYDLDHLIEADMGETIAQIFEKEGQEAFREMEHLALKAFLDENKAFVLATGGGTPCYHHNIELINQSCRSVFINVPTRELAQRLTGQEHAKRPLVREAGENVLGYLNALEKKRQPYFEKAAITFTPRQSYDWLLNQLLEKEAGR